MRGVWNHFDHLEARRNPGYPPKRKIPCRFLPMAS